MTRRDGIYILVAYVINLVSAVLGYLDPSHVNALEAIPEALGATLACALPVVVARLLFKRGGHGWTAVIAAVAMFGRWYAVTP